MNTRISLAIALSLGSLVIGCSGDPEPSAPAACPDGNAIAGACAGVPQQALCDADFCTDGIACGATFNVRTDADLAAAVAEAQPGACIALAPGSYGDAKLPAGVSLLGRGAAHVTVQSVTLGAGAPGGTVRGVTVSGSGVNVEAGVVDAHITGALISNSAQSGIELGAGASVTVEQSEIVGSALYGVRAFDAAGVTVKASIIRGSKGPGFWAQCGGGCDCASPPAVTVSETIIQDNKVIGMSFVGVAATVSRVDVRDHAEAPNFLASGGISASGCSSLAADRVRVLDNSAYGILIDKSSATLGGPEADQALEVSRNFMGIWVQNTGDEQPVKLEGVAVTDNQGVGLGASGGARGIICWNSAITGTQKAVVPVREGQGVGSKEVGDGFTWQGGAKVQIDRLSLSGNARASVLIDGAVGEGSTITNVTLSGGDETKGILQQNVMPGSMGSEPSVGGGAPALTVSEVEMFAVPVEPAAPSGI